MSNPQERLNYDPDTYDYVIPQTYITVRHVVSLIKSGWTWSMILESHKDLDEEGLRSAVLSYVKNILDTNVSKRVCPPKMNHVVNLETQEIEELATACDYLRNKAARSDNFQKSDIEIYTNLSSKLNNVLDESARNL